MEFIYLAALFQKGGEYNGPFFKNIEIKIMKTIGDAVDWAGDLFESSDLFYGHGSDNPWDEALYLVLHVAGQDLEHFFNASEADSDLVFSELLNQTQIDQIKSLVNSRITKKIPLPYLINRAYFAGFEFYIDERVIIPRSPIAELIESGLNIKLEGSEWFDIAGAHHVLDLCCGSGCVGIATALYYDFLEVDLVDISEDALEISNINIKKYELDARVQTIQSDIFSNLKHKKYDLILCNPPYVNQEDFFSMPKEFSHEPELALISGEDGLDLTRKILSQAANYLEDGGVLVLEVGNSAEALEQAYPEVSFLWFEFERGGVGVCAITQAELVRHFS